MARRIISFTILFVLVLVLISTVGVVGIKTANYMVRQNFEFGDALRWAIEDYNEEAEKILNSKANDENYYEWENTINRNVNVVPCVDLK